MAGQCPSVLLHIMSSMYRSAGYLSHGMHVHFCIVHTSSLHNVIAPRHVVHAVQAYEDSI